MYALVKRFFDFFASFIALLLLSPIIAIVALVLFIVNNETPFFVQKRPGKNSRIFKIIKFKSMNDKRDAKGVLLPNEDRLTSIGKFIRKTSLDEIPQLFNVFMGDMSLVGPRPLKVAYLKLYSNEQLKRHNVRPGITGWAQINGRNTLKHSEKFELDVWYINNINFFLDLKILFATVGKVFKKEGVGVNGVNNNQPFNGTN